MNLPAQVTILFRDKKRFLNSARLLLLIFLWILPAYLFCTDSDDSGDLVFYTSHGASRYLFFQRQHTMMWHI